MKMEGVKSMKCQGCFREFEKSEKFWWASHSRDKAHAGHVCSPCKEKLSGKGYFFEPLMPRHLIQEQPDLHPEINLPAHIDLDSDDFGW